jgi:hypothetical protein
VVSNRVSRRQAGRWAEQDQQEDTSQAPPPQPTEPAGDPMDVKLAQLKQLGDLKAQGVLTQAEFDAQKQQLLGS